jgi:hypothetical protein
MSLEAKFESLKLDDVSSVVDAVKKDGPKASGLADGIAVLIARCGGTDDADAIAACTTVKALVEQCPSSQAFVKECLTACTYYTFPFFLFPSIFLYTHSCADCALLFRRYRTLLSLGS